jgi:hypothetical protein
MSQGTLTRVSAKTAAEICTRFALGDQAKTLLRDGLSPRQFLDLLLEQLQFVDAVRLLAYGLPKPEAVWWACLCGRSVAGGSPPPKVAAALQAAEKWIANPSEDHRRAAQKAAEAAELKTPAGCAAMAAFWSGGSLAPPSAPDVPPGEYLTADGVAAAVMIAAVQTEPDKAPEKFRRFCELGIAVANGTNRWQEAGPKK